MKLPTITRVFTPLKRNPWGFGLAMASSLLVVISNFSGVGWSWDSSDYVAVGLNLSNNNGLLDVTNNPMTVRPPGLSVLIALGTWLGIIPNLFLQILNAACATVVVLGTYLLLKRAGINRSVLVVATAFVAFSPALLWQYSMAWSEPPFLAVLIIAMLVSLRQMTYTKVVLMTLLTSSLFFIRYVGPVFALALTIGSTLTNRKQLGIIKSTLVNSAGLTLSFIPVWLWLLRNQRIDGTFTGARAPGGGSFIDPLKTLTATFGTWVVGKPFESGIYMSWIDYPTNAKSAGLLFLAITMLLLITICVRRSKGTWSSGRTSNVSILCLLISVLYICFSAYRFVHWELGPPDNRMLIPLYVPIIIIVSIAIDRIMPRNRSLQIAIAGFFIAILGLHASSTLADAARFGQDGRHWSAKGFQNLPIHNFVKSLPKNSLLMSNQPQQLFAVSQQPPVFNQYQLDAAQDTPCKGRYFVWYNSTYNDGTPDLEGQPEHAQNLYADSWGTVFYLGECNSKINYYWP